MSRCPVCDSGDTALFEHRPGAPVMMHQLYASREAARACPSGDLDLWRCRGCGFVWNRAFDSSLIRYDDDYENDQMNSGVFKTHVADRAADVTAAAPGGEPLDYLEVGCGQGLFLRIIDEAAGARLRTASGFDPAWRGADGARLGRALMHKVYFNSETAGLVSPPPNVVASRHTIEHVPDPVAFLRAIRGALGGASRAALFIETPCVDWIIDNAAMQDLFYEHCSIFSTRALEIAFARAGFGGADVRHVFSGQYLWGKADAGQRVDDAPRLDPLRAADTRASRDYIAHWRGRLEAAAEEGPVALWGAGAKGVTFALLIDRDGGFIDHVIDINPAKQGRFIAGSGLQVLAPETAAARAPKTVFVMNPNYNDEIRARGARAGIKARFEPVN